MNSSFPIRTGTYRNVLRTPLSVTESRNLKANTYLLIGIRGTRAIVATHANTRVSGTSRELAKKINVMARRIAASESKPVSMHCRDRRQARSIQRMPTHEHVGRQRRGGPSRRLVIGFAKRVRETAQVRNTAGKAEPRRETEGGGAEATTRAAAERSSRLSLALVSLPLQQLALLVLAHLLAALLDDAAQEIPRRKRRGTRLPGSMSGSEEPHTARRIVRRREILPPPSKVNSRDRRLPRGQASSRRVGLET